MQQITPVDALKRAIALAGGTNHFAASLPFSQSGNPVTSAHIWNWINRDGGAPAEICPDIEARTGVRCELLRPEVNWAVLRVPRKSRKRITATP